MSSYLHMRKRFASTLCQMMDFSLGKRTSSRSLRVSSLLLLDSSNVVMKRFFFAIEDAKNKKIAQEKVNKRNFTPEKYEEFLESIGSTTMAIVNFFNKGIQSEQERESYINAINKLTENLKIIAKMSGLLIAQNNNEYYLFSDPQLQSTTRELINALELRKIIANLKKNNLTEAASSISRSIQRISKNIEDAERDIKRKQRNRQFEELDLSEPYKVLSYAASFEEKKN